MTGRDCEEVRLAMSGEALRPGIAADVSRHLETCEPCRLYVREARDRPAQLRALAPPMSERQSLQLLRRLRIALSQIVGR